jgi:hypothetical protein
VEAAWTCDELAELCCGAGAPPLELVAGALLDSTVPGAWPWKPGVTLWYEAVLTLW